MYGLIINAYHYEIVMRINDSNFTHIIVPPVELWSHTVLWVLYWHSAQHWSNGNSSLSPGVSQFHHWSIQSVTCICALHLLWIRYSCVCHHTVILHVVLQFAVPDSVTKTYCGGHSIGIFHDTGVYFRQHSVTTGNIFDTLLCSYNLLIVLGWLAKTVVGALK